MGQVLTFAIAVAAFLAIYAVLRRRHIRASGGHQPVQWGWLATIIRVAVVAMVASALLG